MTIEAKSTDTHWTKLVCSTTTKPSSDTPVSHEQAEDLLRYASNTVTKLNTCIKSYQFFGMPCTRNSLQQVLHVQSPPLEHYTAPMQLGRNAFGKQR